MRIDRTKRFLSLLCAICLLLSCCGDLTVLAEELDLAWRTQDLTTSDGQTYRVTVRFDGRAGIPEDAELAVWELSQDSPDYAAYVSQSAAALGRTEENVTLARAFDISLRNPLTGEEYRPDQSVTVSIELLKENLDSYEAVDVVHFHGEAGDQAEILDASVDGESVAFDTDGFSVYVVVVHEGGEILTPRVEFHFLSPDYTESGASYTAAPYAFINRSAVNLDESDENDLPQNSEIVKSGDSLEMIANPPNKEIDNGDGTSSSKYFFGWYIVDASAVDGDGNVTYRWTEEPELLAFEQTVTIDPEKIVWADEAHTAITSLVWEMNGVAHQVNASDNTGDRTVLDRYGCVHVYAAPIYEDYYFINFHAGSRGSDLGGSILARKLVVLGYDQSATVRIGDIQAPSADSRHKIFTGWEGELWDGDQVSPMEMTTVDDTGDELNSEDERDGFYLTLDGHDLYPGKQSVELYPVFTEARWLKFITGATHNGATYVGDRYLYTTVQASDVEDGTAKYFLTDLPATARTGFTFKGWYVNVTETEKDANGDYIDGEQITDENGRIVDRAFTEYQEKGNPESAPLYQLKDGRLYVYKELDAEAGITLYAHWEEITDATVQVIVWRQKVSDDKNAYDYQKKYDFEDSYTIDAHSGMTLGDLLANGLLHGAVKERDEDGNLTDRGDLDLDPGNRSNPDRRDLTYAGFHYRATEMNSPRVKGDGSTTVNIYFDRDLMTIYFYYNGDGGEEAYTYTATDKDAPAEQYGIVEGEYVPLESEKGSGARYTFRYDYQRTVSDTVLPQYGLVAGPGGSLLYQELIQEVNTVTNTRWCFTTGNGKGRTNRYMDQGSTDGQFYVWEWLGPLFGYYRESGYTVGNPPPADDGNDYYCLYNRRFFELTPQSTTTTTYTWKLPGGDVFTEPRYRRMAGAAEYTEPPRTVPGYNGYFGVDDRGGYVELDGTVIPAVTWYTTTHAEDYVPDNSNTGLEKKVYGLVDGNYVELTPVLSGNYAYTAEHAYTPTAETSTALPEQYGLTDGEYERLTWEKTGEEPAWLVEYRYSPSSSTSAGNYFIFDNNQFSQTYLYRYNNRWYRMRTGWWSYSYSDEWTGKVYTRSGGNEAVYAGTVYGLTAGGDFADYAGGTAYGDGGSGVICQLKNDAKDVFGWVSRGEPYNGMRYARTQGAAWTGERLARSGGAAPYTYTPFPENPTPGRQLYGQDGNLGADGRYGHVKLSWTADVGGYTYTDAEGAAQPYTGDRYSLDTVETRTVYTGTRYTRAAMNGFNKMLVYTGLYGQSLAQCGYEWPSVLPNETGTWWWYESYKTSNGKPYDGDGTRTTFLDGFLFSSGESQETFYGFQKAGANTIRFYQEALDGSWLLKEEVSVAQSSNSSFYISDKYDGFYAYAYSTDGASWNLAGDKVNGYYNGGSGVSYSGSLYIRFKRLSYSLIFDPNYPTAAGTTMDGGVPLTLENLPGYTAANTVTRQVSYQTELSADAYRNQPQPAQGPDNYTFGGWYVDATCTVLYQFDEKMPAANMRLYAQWNPVKFRVRIDPNGGVIDHVNYSANALGTYSYREEGYDETVHLSLGSYGAAEGKTGYINSASTYFNCLYNELIGEYTLTRNYVPISDVAADRLAPSQVYYYVNTQYAKGWDLEPDLRNALYVTESELADYYGFYRTWVQYKHDLGLSNEPLDIEVWKETYLQKNSSGGFQKYRKTTGTESYTFVGWYKLDGNGNPEAMPYNFSDPCREATTLRAYWRLDAAYQIRYNAAYTTDEGVLINGNMDAWADPQDETAKYADEAVTCVYRQPTGITANLQPTTDYLFRGWQLVSPSINSQGQTVYTPIENGVYYDPGAAFTVRAEYADAAGVIHMQAVYELKDQAYHRPYVTNLELNANGGFITLDGETELTENTDLGSAWSGVTGAVTATVDDGGVDTELIRFTDIQSNDEVPLYRYATDLTHMGGDAAQPELTPAGHNYFKHPDGHFLLGFDDGSNEGDYVASYPADAAVAVERNEKRTVYAVWEPTVYVKVVNDTGVGDVTFSLSSAEGALQVVNARSGLYDRKPMTAEELSAIRVPAGGSVWLAVPYGVVREVADGRETVTRRHITLEGVNSLGAGYLLFVKSELNGAKRETLQGAITATNADYTAVQNQKSFGFHEELETDPQGIVITFEAIRNPHTLVLDENYPAQGVRTSELYCDETGGSITYGHEKTTCCDLPATTSRLGYIFLGWDPDPDWMARHPDYQTAGEKPAYSENGATGWRIPDLNAFFSDGSGGLASVKTLYAVWDSSVEARIVNLYNDVPEPGDRDKAFRFTVELSGGYTYYKKSGANWNQNQGSFTAKPAVTGQNVFTLKHGERLRIESYQFQANGKTPPYIQASIQKYGAGGEPEGSPVTVQYAWSYAPDEKTYKNFDFTNLTYSVTEDDYSGGPDYYDTALSRTAQTADYSLMLGDSADEKTVPLKNVTGRRVSWTKTDAGGTVIFTNTRQTADVTVRKELTGGNASGVFNFAASYALDGETEQLGAFTVTSGTQGRKLFRIPVGAVLTVTEYGANLNDYTTTAAVDGAARPVTETARSQGGVTTRYRAMEYTVENRNAVVTFTNRLKSFPVTFYKVDQDGKAGVPSYFTLSASTGVIQERLYPNQSGTGEFFPGTTGVSNDLPVGTYTLTETFVGQDYLPLNGPVTLTLSAADGGSLSSSNTDCVKIERVSPADPSGGFKVYVYNQRIVNIRIAKVLSDPLLSTTRVFRFRVQYTYELLGNTVRYDNMDSNNPDGPLTVRSGGSATIRVPVNASLTVTEILSGEDEATYDTAVVRSWTDSGGNAGADASVSGRSYAYSSAAGSAHGPVRAENDGDTLTFTNTRKTVAVTVKKLVENYAAEPDDSFFTFTAALFNGNIAIRDYPIDLNPAGGGTTGQTGQYLFDLRHGESRTLSIPIGARLTLTETAAYGDGEHTQALDLTRYAAAVASVYDGSGEAYTGGKYEEEAMRYDLSPVPSRPLTVTFTNGPGGKDVFFKKTDGFGNALGGAQFALYREYACVTPVQVTVDETRTASFASSAAFSTSDGGLTYNVSFRTAPGVYYMKETGAVSGCEANTAVYRLVVGDAKAKELNVTLNAAGFLLQRMAGENAADPELDIDAWGIMNVSETRRSLILKKGSKLFAPVTGAEFELLAWDRTPVPGTEGKLLPSTATGVFFMGSLPYGYYYLHETAVPAGYRGSALGDWWYTVRVDAQGVTMVSPTTGSEAAMLPGG